MPLSIQHKLVDLLSRGANLSVLGHIIVPTIGVEVASKAGQPFNNGREVDSLDQLARWTTNRIGRPSN